MKPIRKKNRKLTGNYLAAWGKKLTSLAKVSMPKNAVFPQLPEDDDTAE